MGLQETLLGKYKEFDVGVRWQSLQKFEREGQESLDSKEYDLFDTPDTIGRKVMFLEAKRLFPDGGGTACDLGCGFGNQTYPLTELFQNVHGVDQSTVKIAGANTLYPAVLFHVCNLFEDWDWAQRLCNQFDLVQTITFLQHCQFKDKIEILLRVYDLLKKYGFLLMYEGRITKDPVPDAQSLSQSHMFAMPEQILTDIFGSCVSNGLVYVVQKTK